MWNSNSKKAMNLNQIFKSKTITHSAITVPATAINGILGLIFFLILARSLGPEKFGVISITILIMTLAADLADLGINTGLINFIGKNFRENRGLAYKFMKLGLKIKVVTWIVLAMLGILLSPLIAKYLFAKEELTFQIALAMFGVGGAMLFSFVTNSLQAMEKFVWWGIINIFSNGFRLLLTIILITFLTISTENATYVYIAVPFMGFIIGMYLLPQKFLKVSGENSLLPDFFQYNKWVAIGFILAAIYSRLDSLFVTRLLSLKEVGWYSVATQLTGIMPQITYALAVVAAPKLASFSQKEQAVTYLKKLQLLVLTLAMLGLIVVPIAFYAIPYFYGPYYQNSIIPFVILFVGQLFWLLAIPAHQAIFYYFSMPKISTIVSIFQLILVAILGWILTVNFGIIGTSFAILLSGIFTFALSSAWVLYKFNKS